MSRCRERKNRENRWNRRLLRLTAAAFTVFLFGLVFRAGDGIVSKAEDMESVPETEAGYELETEAAQDRLSEAAELTSGHGAWESMEAYYQDCYAGKETRAFYADLTHNGQDELIVLEVMGNASDYSLEADVTVFARSQTGEVRAIYKKEIDQSHTGWGWLYLYEEGEEAYLVEYDPVLYEGTSRYSFDVFSLTPDGGTISLAGDVLEFEWTGETGKSLEDQIEALNRNAFAYLDQSQLIAAVGEEYFSGRQMCEFGN